MGAATPGTYPTGVVEALASVSLLDGPRAQRRQRRGAKLSAAADLEVVIVSWRCESLLRSCLVSLHDHPAEAATRVRVVDNASNDGTAEMVAAEFPEVELTVNTENLGFSAANTSPCAGPRRTTSWCSTRTPG